jgi:membrane protein EpsK
MSDKIIKGRFVGNISANLASFAFNLAVSFWFTPYIVRHLGVEAYGYVPLVLNIVNYGSILTAAFNSMVARFIVVELKKGNPSTASAYFNTSFFVSSAFALLCVPVIIIGTLDIQHLINIPVSLVPGVRALFALAGANFLLSTIMTPFSTAMFYANRFDITNGISVLALFTRIAFMVFMFDWCSPSIVYVGASFTLAAAVSAVAVVIASRRLMPEVAINVRQFNGNAFHEFTSSGIWNSLNQLGTMLLLQIELLMSNVLLGPLCAGQYAATLTFPNLMRGLNTQIVSVFGPTMTFLFARNDIKGLVAYTNQASRIIGMLMGLPLGILLGYGDKIMGLWLGPQFSSQYLLLVILTVQLVIGLPTTPLYTLFVVVNHVRVPGIVTVVSGVCNLVLAYSLGRTSLGAYGIAIAGGASLLLKNLFFTPIYGAALLNQKWWVFFKPIKESLVVTLMTWSLCYVLKYIFLIKSWYELSACIGVTCIVISGLLYSVIIQPDERNQIKGLANKVFRLAT